MFEILIVVYYYYIFILYKPFFINRLIFYTWISNLFMQRTFTVEKNHDFLTLRKPDDATAKKHGATGKPAIDGDDTLIILFSSGTTGLPKGVELTHKNMVIAMDINRFLNVIVNYRLEVLENSLYCV